MLGRYRESDDERLSRSKSKLYFFGAVDGRG